MSDKIRKGDDMDYNDFIYLLKKAISFDEHGNIILKTTKSKCNCDCKCDQKKT